MKTKIVCYIATLIFASLAIRAFANCEAGAYMIHTVAEYKPTGTGTPTLKYIIEKDIFKVRIPTNAGGKPISRRTLQTLTQVYLDNSSCKLGKAAFNKDEMALYQVHFPIGTCKELSNKVPPKGFLVVDLKQRWLKIAHQLEVKAGGTGLPANETAMTKEVMTGKIIPSRDLGGKATSGARKLAKEDISQTRFEYTTVGNFQMAVMILTIINTKPYFPDLENFGVELKGRSIEFPVIFFIENGKSPRFVADGSNCADVKIAQARTETPLAPDRFKLSSAYDLNGDLSPDIIEVNDAFDYELAKGGKLWVIDFQQGC